MSSGGKRSTLIDNCKGILIILVVIRHVLQYSVSDEGGLLTNIIWAIQMPGFMMISGYFSKKDIRTREQIFDCLKKYTLHYLIPFFSWWFIVSTIMLGRNNRNIIRSVSELFERVDRGMWFLWVLFILSIIFTFANYFMNKQKKSSKAIGLVGIGMVFFAVIVFIVRKMGVNAFGIKLIIFYFGYFFIGWLFGSYREKNIYVVSNKMSKIISCISLGCFIYITFNYNLYTSGGLISVIIRYFAALSGMIILLCICQKYEEMLCNFKISTLGKYTLEIYVTHMYVNNLFLDTNGGVLFSLNGFFTFLASLFCTVVFSVLIIIVIKSVPIADFLMFGKCDSVKLQTHNK